MRNAQLVHNFNDLEPTGSYTWKMQFIIAQHFIPGVTDLLLWALFSVQGHNEAVGPIYLMVT